MWFDLLLILSFAWTGFLLGFFSLYLMQRLVANAFGQRLGWVFVVVVLALASLGIYIGRYLRWNSWDVVHAPVALLTNVAGRLVDPFTHPGAYGFSLLCFFFLLSTYLVLYTLTGLRAAPQSVTEIRR